MVVHCKDHFESPSAGMFKDVLTSVCQAAAENQLFTLEDINIIIFSFYIN